MAIKTVGVLGAGVMGAGIAQVAAQAGYKVILRDIEDRFVDGAVARIDKQLARGVEKGRLTEEARQAALAAIAKTTKIADLADADLIIEAVVENLGLKQTVFQELHAVCKPEAIFASNTSSMSITQLAAGSGRPEKFLGLHFFNPVPVMKLVEIIRGELTDEALLPELKAFAESLGKTAVMVLKDSPGFIVNRLLVPYLNEAARLYSEGVASFEDIDTAVKLGLNYPMGPFEMLDMGGMDLTVTTLEYFKEEFGDMGYAPQPIIKQKLRAGKVGRKSGEGFYKYEKKA